MMKSIEKQRLNHLTHWPDEIVNAIASMEEANIYIKAELTWAEHMGDGNNTILHQAGKESEIDRQQFDREKSDYWKARFKAFTKAELDSIYKS